MISREEARELKMSDVCAKYPVLKQHFDKFLESWKKLGTEDL